MTVPRTGVRAPVREGARDLSDLVSIRLPEGRPSRRSRPRRPWPRRRRPAVERRARRGWGLAWHPWRWIGLGLSLLAWVALAVLWWHPAFRVEKVRFYGLVRVNAQRVSQWEPLVALKGQPAVAVQPRLLGRMLQEAFPVFREVQVTVSFPNVVSIRVQEREPVLVWHEGDATFWVDVEGVRFYAWGEPNPLWPHVYVQGGWPNATLEPQEVAFLLELGRRLGLRELVFHPEYGFGWRAPQGWQVYIGTSMHDWDARLALYQQVARELEDQGRRPRVIRLLSPYAVVILPEEDEEEGRAP